MAALGSVQPGKRPSTWRGRFEGAERAEASKFANGSRRRKAS